MTISIVFIDNTFKNDICQIVLRSYHWFYFLFSLFQVEASYPKFLSEYPPCSWWFSSSWTFECSTIFVFSYIDREICACWRFMSMRIWESFHNICILPCYPGCHIPDIFPLWDVYGNPHGRKMIWKWTRTFHIYPQKAS